MKTLHWSGKTEVLTLVDLVRPGNPDDDVTQVFSGLASNTVWSGGRKGARLEGTAGGDLVFLDLDGFKSRRLENISSFDMGGGSDVVDLSSDRFHYGPAKLVGRAGDDWLYGNDGKDRILGGDGHDRLKGGDGNDVITGGAGVDELFGGAGSDRFVFGFTDGKDNVYDFVTTGPNHDVIDFRQVTQVRTFTDLMNNHVLVEDGELKITLDDASYVRLYGLTPADLQADNFIF